MVELDRVIDSIKLGYQSFHIALSYYFLSHSNLFFTFRT